ncbi:MAG: hydroxymethylglutaryl-CoA reductase [Actinobacteria bacterium]|jgi:hydroxymethylglutaryl-CoA reductase (NADPH)|nr:MAG: hydroxymethylglutaryl-CoA reductase [Actinomycetota bacterium]
MGSYETRRLPRGGEEKDVLQRQLFVEERGAGIAWIKRDPYSPETVKGNIENYIGTARLPIGLAGPLLIHGDHARGEFYVPLATTEGSLVASYNRGMRVIGESGGCRVKIFEDHMQRAPMFRFSSLAEAEKFTRWLADKREIMDAAVSKTTSHGRLSDVDIFNLGRNVYVRFGFHTGDAAGQNMVNLATSQVCRDIAESYPGWDAVESFNLASKFCSDKKYSQINVLKSRGKKVTAEVEIPEGVLRERLRTTTAVVLDNFLSGTLSAIYAGCVSNGFHAANGIAALFIACGNDAANVAESHVDILDLRPAEGGLYFAATLPSLIVGTVGGGTSLPTQGECLDILGCRGAGNAGKFAEIVAAVVLAGEISLVGAITSDEWVGAHEKLGRNRPREDA